MAWLQSGKEAEIPDTDWVWTVGKAATRMLIRQTMKAKELSKQVRDKVIEKHRSGQCYNKISKSLIIPLSAVKSVIRMCNVFRNTQVREPFQTKQGASRKLVSDATVKPTMILKYFQSSEMGVIVNTSTIPQSLYEAGLYGRVAGKKPLLEKNHLKSHMEFETKRVNDTASM
ncbi:uncharacterized protein LOC143227486 [Tachypleus tridentatus]|uniref:uncharacterized protein LOC143227486 n=1 Tax=Tachypleus tridentatus TaxID=6853 RepID=UPI003FD0A779